MSRSYARGACKNGEITRLSKAIPCFMCHTIISLLRGSVWKRLMLKEELHITKDDVETNKPSASCFAVRGIYRGVGAPNLWREQ